MSSSPLPNPNVPQIPQPIANVGALVNVAQVLKQGVDSLAGNRGDTRGRAVTFNDLINLGLVTTTGDFSSPSAAGPSSNLTVEIAARIAGDKALTTAIGTETARAEAAEHILATSIASETARAEAAETSLGTVKSVVAGPGLTGGTITTAGTLSMAPISNATLLGNASNVASTPVSVGLGIGLVFTAGRLAATARTAVLPLVNGDLPGPAFMSDPNGQPIGVPI